MIIIGTITAYNSGKVIPSFEVAQDIYEAKLIRKTQNERNFCDRFGIFERYCEFHDTETNKSWSVFGTGVSKHKYISEKAEEFRRRINNMALPTYDKTKRRKAFQQLPKDAYVITIKGAKIEKNKNTSGEHITIIFDIAEGEYKNFYLQQFEANTNEDKTWPYDATFCINIPYDGCEDWIWTNYNSFFADIEDSNSGFVFDGDVKSLKGKIVGGKFRIEQSEYNGNVYDHTRLRWTCVADDVRKGNAGSLPKDKLISGTRSARRPDPTPDAGFVTVPEGTEEELPF